MKTDKGNVCNVYRSSWLTHFSLWNMDVVWQSSGIRNFSAAYNVD